MYKDVETSKKINVIDKCTKVVSNYKINLFRLFDSKYQATTTIDYYEFDESKFGSYIKSNCYRVAEDRVRQKMGLPKIGQGWLGETKLYYEIKKLFTKFTVTQRERLPFLGQQHLDVFIHELRIGLEYQGDQHSKPIDFFGGETTFTQTQERDKRKKELCEKKGISLIYVYPGYDIEDVLIAIKEICINRGIDLSIDKLTETDLVGIQNEIDKQYFRNNSQSPINRHVKPKSQKEDKFTKWINDKGVRVHSYTENEISNFENHYLKKLDESNDPIDKHYWLSELSYLHYRHREHSGAIEKCMKYSLRDIGLFEDCMARYEMNNFDSLKTEFRQTLGHNPIPDPKTQILMYSFVLVIKRPLIIYEKLEKYDEAIGLCKRALKMGMKDITTKTGFEGRIIRYQKMKSKSKAV